MWETHKTRSGNQWIQHTSCLLSPPPKSPSLLLFKDILSQWSLLSLPFPSPGFLQGTFEHSEHPATMLHSRYYTSTRVSHSSWDFKLLKVEDGIVTTLPGTQQAGNKYRVFIKWKNKCLFACIYSRVYKFGGGKTNQSLLKEKWTKMYYNQLLKGSENYMKTIGVPNRNLVTAPYLGLKY